MKSANVTCKATSCIHNQNCECMAGVINVKGLHATTPPATSCNTFVLEGGYTFDNLASLHDDQKTQTDKIRCNASNCIHNDDGGCYADSVQIIAANASCGTFECML